MSVAPFWCYTAVYAHCFRPRTSRYKYLVKILFVILDTKIPLR